MMMIGASLFLFGSLLRGLSQEMWQLIAFRSIQGLGAGAIFPIALAVIGDLFSPANEASTRGCSEPSLRWPSSSARRWAAS